MSKTISEKEFRKLVPTVSRHCILYGLPKLHKTNIPVSSILSAIGIHSYNLATFVGPLLCALSLSSYLISDRFSFIQVLSSLGYKSSNLFMVGFDIASLYTNIPINETVNIILNETFSSAQFFIVFLSNSLNNFLNCLLKMSFYARWNVSWSN